MTSKIAIANRALTKIGEPRVVSLDDSQASQEIDAMWDILRDSELRKNRWGFAITREQVAASVTAPAFGYTTAYPLPADCLRVLMLGDILPGYDPTDYRNGADSSEWVIEGRSLLTNTTGDLNLRYVRQVEDTTQWDAAFIETFACRLAIELCERITQSSEKRQQAKAEYRDALGEARRAGALELPSVPIADDSWVLVRVRG